MGASVHALGYDAQGNVSNKDGTAFDFDYGNRLHGATYNGSTLESYWYDGYGRRVISTAPTGTIQSIYSQGGQLLYQDNGRTGKQTKYFYLSGSLVAEFDHDVASGANSNRYQHTDALGSPVVVTNGPHSVLERNEYEPYGQVLKGGYADRPGYTGHVKDAATGMNYMQQRYYDPMIGRFLSVDPVTALSNPVGMFNRYDYAANNPYKFTDPDGRTCKSVRDKWDCKIDRDEQGKKGMTEEQRRARQAFKNAYTSAVNKLMSHPTRTVTIKLPSGKTATTTAGEVGKALISRKVVVQTKDTENGMGTRGDTTYVSPNDLTGRSDFKGAPVTANDQENHEIQITHEGMHGDGAPSTNDLQGDLPDEEWTKAHQIPFNDAAQQLLGD